MRAHNGIGGRTGLMKDLRLAIAFLTLLPVAPRGVHDMGPSRAYFPLVGLALGAVLAALDGAVRLILPTPVAGALLVTALLVITRALHTEGFLDVCDALPGGFSAARRLEILRDPQVGAFAVVAGICLLLLKWTTLTDMPEGLRPALLVLFPCLSRCGMLTTMAAFPYVRQQGTGSSFQVGARGRQIAFGVASAAAACLLLQGAAGLILLAAAILVSLALGRWSCRLLGGMTGDSYGAANEVAEVTVLLLGTALYGLDAGLLASPLWQAVPA